MATKEPSRRLVHAAHAFTRGMLHEGHDPVGHEATAPHGVPGAGHLSDLHHAAPGRDHDAPSGSRGHDLDALHATGACVYQDLYSVTLHRGTDATAPAEVYAVSSGTFGGA